MGPERMQKSPLEAGIFVRLARLGGLVSLRPLPSGRRRDAPTFTPACAQASVSNPVLILLIDISQKSPLKAGIFVRLARLGGFEPPTAWFVARYSIQLSYSRLTRMSFD